MGRLKAPRRLSIRQWLAALVVCAGAAGIFWALFVSRDKSQCLRRPAFSL